jgi:hypothetical protein
MWKYNLFLFTPKVFLKGCRIELIRGSIFVSGKGIEVPPRRSPPYPAAGNGAFAQLNKGQGCPIKESFKEE